MTTDQGDSWTEKGNGYFDSTTSIRSLLYASDGAIYAGTSPNAEVFVSVDKGDTWISTGELSGANTVYKLIETTKAGVRQDSVFLFAATGPNGDVFRGLLFVVGIIEKENIIDNSMVPQMACKTPVRGDFMLLNISVNDQRTAQLNIMNTTGAVVHQSYHQLKQGTNSIRIEMNDLSQGIYFLSLNMESQCIIRKIVRLK